MTDWIEPPLEEVMDVSGDGSQSRPPCARFLARLDPPLTIPGFQEASAADMSADNDLAFALIPGLPSPVTRTVYIPDQDAEKPTFTETKHSYTLHPSLKPTKWGYATEIPFSHPKDLVPLFRILRQYASVTTLLENIFRHKNDDTETPTPSAAATGISLEDFLEGGIEEPARSLSVDIQLSLDNDIGISVVFPVDGGLINLKIVVEKNGGLRVLLLEDSTNRAAAVNPPIDVQAVERALKASEDIGLVIEWIRRRYF